FDQSGCAARLLRSGTASQCNEWPGAPNPAAPNSPIIRTDHKPARSLSKAIKLSGRWGELALTHIAGNSPLRREETRLSPVRILYGYSNKTSAARLLAQDEIMKSRLNSQGPLYEGTQGKAHTIAAGSLFGVAPSEPILA